MSWSSGVTNVKGSEIEAALTAASVQTPDFGRAESLEAAEEAKRVVVGLLRSGQLGSEDQTYSIYLSGHANPDHVKPPEWVADCMTITIRQEPPAQETS